MVNGRNAMAVHSWDIHLLISLFLFLSLVSDILQSELGEPPLILPNSNCHDSVLCSEVADITWDGRNEIILGTYGKVHCKCVQMKIKAKKIQYSIDNE